MIHIFSTKIGEGRGGISKALVGYKEAFESSNVSYDEIITHEGEKKFFPFIFSLLFCIFKVKSNDFCWFHGARWVSLIRKYMLLKICKIKRARVVFHFHSVDLDKYLDNVFLCFLVNRILVNSDVVVVVSGWWKNRLADQFPSYKDKIVVSPNPLETAFEGLPKRQEQKNFSYNQTPINLIAMSRLEKGKGFRELISSLLLLEQNYILHIIGDGSLKDALLAFVTECNLTSRVVFHGWLETNAKISALDKADIFCLPSSYDSFGMVYIEAMAVGLPVVALNLMSCPYIIPSNGGVLLDNDSPESIAAGIKKVSVNYSDYSGGKDHVSTTFSKDAITKEFLKSIGYVQD